MSDSEKDIIYDSPVKADDEKVIDREQKKLKKDAEKYSKSIEAKIEKRKEKEEKLKKKEEQKKQEEEQKSEYIRKIKSALADDLLGSNPDYDKYKTKDYEKMKYSAVKEAWLQLKSSVFFSHPRNFIWTFTLEASKKIERAISAYPDYAMDGFTEKIANDPKMKLAAHLMFLDYIPHGSNGEVFTLLNGVYDNYQLCRKSNQFADIDRQAIKNQKISVEDKKKFDHL